MKDVTESPYAAEVGAAAQAATTEFERDILADGVISDDEWNEASNRYIACMKDRGIDTSPYPDGSGFRYHDLADPDAEGSFDWDAINASVDAANSACEQGTIAVIAGLYQSMKLNPDKRDMWNDLIPACLLRVGVTIERLAAGQIQAEIGEGGRWSPPPPDVEGCLTDPVHFKAG